MDRTINCTNARFKMLYKMRYYSVVFSSTPTQIDAMEVPPKLTVSDFGNAFEPVIREGMKKSRRDQVKSRESCVCEVWKLMDDESV